MGSLVDRLLTLLLPERALDAEERAVLDAEDTAQNLARVRAWMPVTLLVEVLSIAVMTRTPTSTVNDRAWLDALLTLHGTTLALYATAWAVSMLLTRVEAPRVARALTPSLFATTFAIFACISVNAQRVTGSVIAYIAVILAAPFFLRGSMAMFLVLVAAADALLMAGIAAVQTSDLLRAMNTQSVFFFSLLALGMARVQRRGIIDDLRLRRELERFNRELEARVTEKTRELRAFAERVDEVLEHERRRLARDLHDDLGQELTALRLEVETLRAHADGDDDAALARMSAGIDRSHLGVRAILESLRPRMLDEEGLEASIRWLARQLEGRAGVACEVDVTLDEDPPPQVGLVAFRVAQEAITNVARHAKATRVQIALRREGDALLLTIDDDGRHGRPTITPGRGLTGMRERVAALGGELTVASRETGGTRVHARLPWVSAE